MKPARDIKAVFMDVDDTLLDFNECARQNIKECFALNGLPYTDHVFDVFLKRNIEYWKRIELGTLTVEELHRTRWNSILKELGLEADGQKFELDFIAGLREQAVPIEGADHVMAYLHSKYKVFVVSNATCIQQSRRLGKVDLLKYCDGIFGSLDIGFNKPDARYYDYCWQHTGGIGPKETVIIGDSLTADIRGGIEQGMLTCWFNHRHTEKPDVIVPDITIEKLDEICSIF